MTLRGEGREGGRLSQVENPVVRGEILGEKIVVNVFLFIARCRTLLVNQIVIEKESS